MQVAEQLAAKIEAREARVGILGLGYVGLPLSVEFASAGLTVTGLDLDRQKVDGVNAGRSHIKDVEADRLGALVASGRLRASANLDDLASCDAVIICVPTPLSKTKDPDLTMVVDAAKAIAARLRPGQLVVLESTTYPGTTEELIQPLLEEGGLKAGESLAQVAHGFTRPSATIRWSAW